MSLDLSVVGTEIGRRERSWEPRDCMLYALGVGCGVDELQFATEKQQRVLPTFATIAGGGSGFLDVLGPDIARKGVHAEHSIEVLKPIKPTGSVKTTTKVRSIWDKGNSSLVVFESTARDAASGEALFVNIMTIFIRGVGGFGGERGPSTKAGYPERDPDHVSSYKTHKDQALLYRLNGDMTPLHSDPELAVRAGFEAPILHGMCTFGFAGRGIMAAMGDTDGTRLRSMGARFSKPVYPGDTLTVSVWCEGNEAIFRVSTDRGNLVLEQGCASFVPANANTGS